MRLAVGEIHVAPPLAAEDNVQPTSKSAAPKASKSEAPSTSAPSVATGSEKFVLTDNAQDSSSSRISQGSKKSSNHFLQRMGNLLRGKKTQDSSSRGVSQGSKKGFFGFPQFSEKISRSNNAQGSSSSVATSSEKHAFLDEAQPPSLDVEMETD